MVSGDRQRVIETNRSLRLIKNELESLLEKGVITDEAFDQISSLLPAESSLSGGLSRSQQPTPTPAPTTTTAAAAAATPSPTSATPAPPSYAQSTASPPALPIRNQPPAPAPAPAPPPEKPVLAHARALYRYAATDARDLSFERDDRLAVHEHMNADWWLGRNLRTGLEGIFPRSYVHVVEDDEKQQQQQALYQPPLPGSVQYATGGGYPPAPPAGQGYVPPQQQGEGEGSGSSKIGEHGKKSGKKLGNAAIFGAGATIGSNIVNSIF